MKKTIWFITITLAIIAIYDVWVIFAYGNEESISAHILSMGAVVPQIPLALGYIFGHLTWPFNVTDSYRNKVMPFSIAASLVIMYLGIIDVYQLYWGGGLEAVIFGGREFYQMPLFVAGYVFGHFLWPMPESKWKDRYKGDK